jgi:signal transduction histidine kinase
MGQARMDRPLDSHSGSGIQLSGDDLAKLLEVGRTLVAELDVEALLRRILETARELTGARYAALGILDDRKQELERFVFLGIDDETRRLIGPLPRGGGVLGELIRDPRLLRLADVGTHPRSYGFPPGHPPMKTFLGMPVVIRGEVFGNLYLTDKANGAEFDERDEHATVVLAEWAAIAIGNARLYQDAEQGRAELERVVQGLEATATVARAVGFETDIDRVLELIVKRGRALINARSLLVLLVQGDELCVAGVAGEAGGDLLDTRLPLDGTLPSTVMNSGEPERVARLADRVGHGLDAVAQPDDAVMVCTLGFRGRARGVLVAIDSLSGQRTFGPEQQNLLASFGASAAIAIATAQSVEAERLKHSVRASESERRRWARELHDETLQELGALKVAMQAAHSSGRPEAYQGAVEASLEQLELSITSLQSLITELRPASLDELGVQPAVEALARRTSARFGVAVDVRCDLAFEAGRRPTRLVGDVESTAYRLVQEAITNAVKHSETETISVALLEEDGGVSITVRDEGKGFDPDAASAGFGLLGMRERVELVDGRVLIDSAPGAGTTVHADLPALHREGDDPVTTTPPHRSAQG